MNQNQKPTFEVGADVVLVDQAREEGTVQRVRTKVFYVHEYLVELKDGQRFWMHEQSLGKTR